MFIWAHLSLSLSLRHISSEKATKKITKKTLFSGPSFLYLISFLIIHNFAVPCPSIKFWSGNWLLICHELQLLYSYVLWIYTPSSMSSLNAFIHCPKDYHHRLWHRSISCYYQRKTLLTTNTKHDNKEAIIVRYEDMKDMKMPTCAGCFITTSDLEANGPYRSNATSVDNERHKWHPPLLRRQWHCSRFSSHPTHRLQSEKIKPSYKLLLALFN